MQNFLQNMDFIQLFIFILYTNIFWHKLHSKMAGLIENIPEVAPTQKLRF